MCSHYFSNNNSRWIALFKKIGSRRILHGRNLEFFHRVSVGHYFWRKKTTNKCHVCHGKVDNTDGKGYFVHQYFECKVSQLIFKLCDIRGVELSLEAFFNPKLTIAEMVSIGFYLRKVYGLHCSRFSELDSVDEEWAEEWFQNSL